MGKTLEFLQTVITLTDTVEDLAKDVSKANDIISTLSERIVRLETIIEVKGADAINLKALNLEIDDKD